jgi:hypothetical protein
MGLFTGLLTLPIAPLRGVVTVAEQVRRQAEAVYYDPAAIQEELDRVEAMRASGELSEEDATAREDELIERLLVGRETGGERHG